jgi:hypothetical protein
MSTGSALTPGAIEQLPKWLLCVPLVIQWLWLAIRFRSLTLPSVVNPEIETGGLAGESKLTSLARIEADHAAWVHMPWASVRATTRLPCAGSRGSITR